MSFDGGPQPPLYRQPSYPAPPQTPISHGTPYEYGSSYANSHHEMAQYAIPITATGKRKAQRASQVRWSSPPRDTPLSKSLLLAKSR